VCTAAVAVVMHRETMRHRRMLHCTEGERTTVARLTVHDVLTVHDCCSNGHARSPAVYRFLPCSGMTLHCIKHLLLLFKATAASHTLMNAPKSTSNSNYQHVWSIDVICVAIPVVCGPSVQQCP
jgi:hypothetical protein